MDNAIPSILPILALPPNQILFPQQSLNELLIHPPLSGQLFRLLSNHHHPQFIGCVPLKFNHPSSSNHNLQRFQIKLITNNQLHPNISRIAITAPSPYPQPPSQFESSTFSIDQLCDWGCIARIIKIDHSKSDHSLKLDLLGIHRFKISRHIRSDQLPFQARIASYPEVAFATHPAEQERANKLVKEFKIVTTGFILLLSHSINHRYSTELEKRPQFSQLIESLELPQISRMIDLMIRDVQVIPWEDKLQFLTYYQLQVKLEKFIDLISRTSDQIQNFYRNSNLSQLSPSIDRSPDSLQLVKIKDSDSDLTPQQKELLLRYRLKAIRSELQQGLDQLNQLYDHPSSPLVRPTNDKLFPVHVPFHKPNTRPIGRPFIIGTRRGMGPFDNGGSLPPELDSGEDELQELEKKIYSAGMSKEAFEICSKELKRLRSIPPSSVEHSVIKNYLEIMVEIPWSKSTIDATMKIVLSDDFLLKARAQLDIDHYGMLKVKHRLVEFLAVIKHRIDLEARSIEQNSTSSHSNLLSEKPTSIKTSAPNQIANENKLSRLWKDNLDPTFLVPPHTSHSTDQSSSHSTNNPSGVPLPILKESTQKKSAPILLLVGPPGVGKTSIARSIAKALHKKFYRISLGGVRDEAEIRGHRRTYVGSMPGAIAQALRRVGVNDPVILLDEIDKVGHTSFNGDPASALLEVLDPEQNSSFVDHYINTPIDLSSVLFLATANTIMTISPPLLDRLEVIELDGYVLDEKLNIAKRNLIPKQMENYSLKPKQFILDDDEILKKIILNYTRESGVRGLEREIGNLCRAKVLEFVKTRSDKNLDKNESKQLDDKSSGHDQFRGRIQMDDLYKILGPIKFEIEVSDMKLKPGVAIGMAYEGSGNGSILFIEATRFPGNGMLKLTGSLGEVIKESAELAISWIKSNSKLMNLDLSILEKSDLHIHLPSGSIRKDGPSAGVGLVLALVSLFIDRPIDNTLAVTGEISLRGRVLPVGGIREKVLAAHGSGIKEIILPQKNMREIEEEEESLKKVIKRSMKINYVSSLSEVIEIVFKNQIWNLRQQDGSKKRLDDQVDGKSKSDLKGQSMNDPDYRPTGVQRENFQKSINSSDSCL